MMISEVFQYLFSPSTLLLLALGTWLGIIVGAIPGLTGAMLIALSLPLTFSMEGTNALALLIAMYVGSVSGGLITATLLKMPGTPSSIMTTLDGYPLAASGSPGRALGLGISASGMGGLISWVFLATLAAPVARFAHHLGPFDFFALIMMAMALISLVGESMILGLLSGFIGILFSMPGFAPSSGEARLTFGFAEMNDGFKLLPVMIGLYAIGEVVIMLKKDEGNVEEIIAKPTGLWMSLADWKKYGGNIFRSSLLGTWIGALPGIGANVGSVTAYTLAKKSSKHPEKFGQGSEEGIVASESANNATVGGALIPLLAMGIPGSVIDAILLGGMVIHGLQPGPLLMKNQPEAVWSLTGAMLISNFMMVGLMVLSVGWLSKLAKIPKTFLVPSILVFCVIGSYGLSNRMFDVWVMLFFGLIGLGMRKLKLPLAPFIIGFVLWPIAEENLGTALMSHHGSLMPIFKEPVACTLLVLALAMLLSPTFKNLKKKSQ
jgi:putative tricarboxylic transport membrane protein